MVTGPQVNAYLIAPSTPVETYRHQQTTVGGVDDRRYLSTDDVFRCTKSKRSRR